MRIRNSGAGFRGFGGKSRSDSFKQKHKLGGKIKGKLLKRVSDDMAWVSIDGDKLLAQLHSAHKEGASLTFIIKQLTPDIILKEVFEFSSGSANALDLANNFNTARTLFENRFRSVQQTLKANNATSKVEKFLELLANNPALYASFKDATICAQTISTHLETTTTGHLLYQPWLAPEGRRQTTFIRNFPQQKPNPLIETIVEFEHSSWGMVRVEFLYKRPKAGFKLKLQHPAQSDSLLHYLTTRSYPDLTTKMECLGVKKLPQNKHGGILTELMFGKS